MYIKGKVEYGDIWQSGEESAYLPHSCDEWVIGGRKEIEDLIADLTEIMDKHFPKPLS